MKDKLINYIKAKYSCLWCLGHEENRITHDILSAASELKHGVWIWSNSTGMQDPSGATLDKSQDPILALNHVLSPQSAIPKKSIIIMKDLHAFLEHPIPLLVRKIKDVINYGRGTNRTLIIVGCKLKIPDELAKEIKVIHCELPSRQELREKTEAIAEAAKVTLENGDTEHIVDAGCGMTLSEFEDACAYAKVTEGKFDPLIIQTIKSDVVRDGGLLEIIQSKITLDDIGGLEVFKKAIWHKRNLFTKAAKQYGLDNPRPILAVGQPGTGKSLGSEALKNVFGLPLLRLEAGRLFGSLVGETEGNWRKAFSTAKAIAPAIVHIDEIDGLVAGSQSSGRTDGGTTVRTVKTMLQDLQFNCEGLLFYFTANDIDGLPDPLIDRCEVWNVELPHLAERRAIWSIHIQKRGRKPTRFDVEGFAEKTDGFSGRQIEQAWLQAMEVGFNAEREVNDKDVYAVLTEFVPTAVTMKHQIEARRNRLKNCAKLASAPPEASSFVEKVKRKLKAEVVKPEPATGETT